MTRNLWGTIPTLVKDTAYTQIMRDQAKLLEEQTHQELTGWLEEYSFNGNVVCEFSIMAPRLNRYRYTILRTIQGFYPFPILIYDRSRLSNDIWNMAIPEVKSLADQLNTEAVNLLISPEQSTLFWVPTYKIQSDEEFENALAEILQSEKTKEIITALLSKVQTMSQI
ncbi:MAG: hypothetical protein LBJ67_16410 [Planctomycetaceae bacterium]|jgi:hypothetical protein|nr:hypothetical protein [Planctomycetaceae bacterium]